MTSTRVARIAGSWILCIAVATSMGFADPAESGESIRDSREACEALGGTDSTRTSPFDPQAERDDIYVADSGPFLDTGCSFRDEGPLVIEVMIDRVVGDVDSDGYLVDWPELVQNGIISEKAAIRMPAFDVDFTGGGGFFNPERDRVFLNGQVIDPNNEYLQGENNTWKLNSFVVDTNRLRFPADPGRGGVITPVKNVIRIDIDTANRELVWCTAIDWVEISIDAVRPVLLVHGINVIPGSDPPATWDLVWEAGLTETRVINEGSRAREALDLSQVLGVALDSIQDNAVKIGNRVDAMKSRYGVDRVNIVSHSKGGIDSRHFAENSDSIDRLYQIGTPNAGSPLADYFQAAAIVSGGKLLTALFDIFAAPAGVQLTTPYMFVYNRTHDFNPNVEYNAIAGVHDAAFFGDPVGALLNSIIPGEDDTIVPAWSVYALSYTNDFDPIRSQTPNDAGKHTSQTGSGAYFNAYRSGLLRAGRAVDAPEQGVSLEHTRSVTDAISENEIVTSEVTLDGGGRSWISLAYGSGDLDLAIFTPAGTRIDRDNVDSFPGVAFGVEEPANGIKWEVFELSNPEPGAWAVEVAANRIDDDSGEEAFHVAGWFENATIELAANLERTSVRIGEQMRIVADVGDGAGPVVGAVVFADVVLPDETLLRVDLRDDGVAPDTVADDGSYTGDLSIEQPGIHRLAVEAAGPSIKPFSREVFLLAAASSVSGAIEGNYDDRGQDANGNGLFDRLEIGLDVSTSGPAETILLGRLVDLDGHVVASAAVEASVPGGTTRLTLPFDGKTIAEARSDGPYDLEVVRLTQSLSGERYLLDEGTGVFRTKEYERSSFERPPILFTRNGADRAFDDDANGKFDRLEIDAEVQLRFGGRYAWSGALVDGSGREIDFFADSGSLGSGPNTLTFPFAGEKIGASGVDGPYALSNVLVNGAGQGAVGLDVYRSAAYAASEFEGFVPTNQPPFADAGGDVTKECAAPTGTQALLDGSHSTDPDDDPLTFSWTAASVVFDDPASTQPIGTFPLGGTTVLLTVTDPEGLSDSDEAVVTIQDTIAPAGDISFPEPDVCFGNDDLPVTVTDSYEDICDADLDRVYEPNGGPSYSEHGDFDVRLTVSDSSGNQTTGGVPFTIDLTDPSVQIFEPTTQTVIPDHLPFNIVFDAADDDRATGDVLHERVLIDGCVLFDGDTFGDGDGLLRDETLVLDHSLLCSATLQCGVDVIDRAVIRVEATDCGQNVGDDVVQLLGSAKLRPGICDF